MINCTIADGGIPTGLLVLWAARPNDGYNSTLMYEHIKRAIDEGKQIVYLDYEGSIDPEWLQSFGINNQEK